MTGGAGTDDFGEGLDDGLDDGVEPGVGARGWPRLLRPLLATVIALGVLLVGIFPTRAIVEQRAELARLERSRQVVADRNAELRDRIEALGTDAEIERIAREQYNLGRPGEEVYAILPPPPADGETGAGAAGG
jgi:cell division protein FtsB